MKRFSDCISDHQTQPASKRYRPTHNNPSFPDHHHHHQPSTPSPPATQPTTPGSDPPPGPSAGHQQQPSSNSTKPPKPPPPSFTEVDSLRRQAEPYRLAIAEFPIDLLTSSWSRGSNRPLDRNHVAHLCRSFRHGNLARRAEENYIQVTCSAAAVDSIISTIAATDRHPHHHDLTKHHHVLSFRHWADVNDEKPELMAGQHRIEALRDYVKQTGSGSDDLWWVCEFYDKGASLLSSHHHHRVEANMLTSLNLLSNHRRSSRRVRHQAPRQPSRPYSARQSWPDLAAARLRLRPRSYPFFPSEKQEQTSSREKDARYSLPP